MEQVKNDENLKDILNNIDVLAEGRFILSLASISTHYVGSTNQRILDVQKSLKKGKPINYKEKEDV